MKKSLLIFIFLTALNSMLFADNPPSPLTLWYDQPASQWEEALPIGNGTWGQ
nr:glycoside hydrolase N-terminal domain-containing protein [Marinilabilia salmonicolor]